MAVESARWTRVDFSVRAAVGTRHNAKCLLRGTQDQEESAAGNRNDEGASGWTPEAPSTNEVETRSGVDSTTGTASKGSTMLTQKATRLTDEQIRETVVRMNITKPAIRDALLKQALAGDGNTLVVLRLKARQLGVV